jgi:hypothetical protein
MEMQNMFYIGGMMFLTIGNSIQIGKGFRKSVLSWMQVAIYTGTLVWYFVLQTHGGLTSQFFFFTTLAFILSLMAEVSEVTRKGSPAPLDILVFLLSLAPVIFSLGILTGMF